MIEVHDPADPRLDDFRDLTIADRRPDRPGGRGLVIAEGVIVVRRLLGSRYPVRALLGTARRLAELADEVRRLLPDWHRPERFYERRSEIAGRLAELAREERRRAGG